MNSVMNSGVRCRPEILFGFAGSLAANSGIAWEQWTQKVSSAPEILSALACWVRLGNSCWNSAPQPHRLPALLEVPVLGTGSDIACCSSRKKWNLHSPAIAAWARPRRPTGVHGQMKLGLRRLVGKTFLQQPAKADHRSTWRQAL